MSARRSILTVAAWTAVLAAALPATAGAYATPAPPPKPTGASGLPDGRVYEQVSPANKHGNEVSGRGNAAFAASDGQAILYWGSGALGERESSGSNTLHVSRRASQGWFTHAATPIGAPGTGEGSWEGEEGNTNLVRNAVTLFAVARADLAHVAFTTWGHGAFAGPPDEAGMWNNFYMAGPDPLAEPAWIAESQVDGALEGTGGPGFKELFPAGGSPDLKTLYFIYEGSLLPTAPGEEDSWLYEYRDGALSDAGELPGGEKSASTAWPAAQSFVERNEFRGFIPAAGFANQVSADGSRIFFTRQDEAGTLELYVRITAPDGTHRTLLVSRSQLEGHAGEAAPSGPLAMPSTEIEAPYFGLEGEPVNGKEGNVTAPSYAFASPDGSHVFFQSADRLTGDAPEDATAKTYVFDVDTETLEYLPGITGSIVSVSDDGSSLVFENMSTTPFELDRWVAGAGGGSVTPIAQLPEPSVNFCHAVVCVGPAYTSSDGNVIVFSTESPIAGFNDGGSHHPLNFEEKPEAGSEPLPNKQIFRYDVASGELGCLSCPPQGVTPSGNAIVSNVDQEVNSKAVTGAIGVAQDDRGMSSDGRRVFFETPEALAPQDRNGRMDVYEWESGMLFLISSGRSPEQSFLLDSSESGGDVFFTTTEGIAQGDTDGGRDVYDARVPRPGDTPPPAALPCEGDVCQGAPSVPNLLGAPASATFSGLGNLLPQPAAKPKPKPKKKAKPRKRRRGKPRRHKAKGSRRAAQSSAHVKHGTRRGK